MKKVFLMIGIVCLCICAAQAQTQYPRFSGSLGGGAVSVRRGTVIRGGDGSARTVVPARKRTLQKIVLRYEPEQIYLTDEQMQSLMPLLQRMQAGEVTSLDVVGIARDYNLVYHRQNSLRQVLQSYAPSVSPHFRQITGAGVVSTNDNTMEFIEYR